MAKVISLNQQSRQHEFAVNPYPLEVHDALANFNRAGAHWLVLACRRHPAVYGVDSSEVHLHKACELLQCMLGSVNLWVGMRIMTRCVPSLERLSLELQDWSERYPSEINLAPWLSALLDAVRAAEADWVVKGGR